ncbi:MAG: hypothetical protein HGA54_00945 [Actinobacteria bacterium]|nr:hypothetical protein [Actinomycetota bacterium]
MTKEDRDKLKDLLFEIVERGAKSPATDAEIAASTAAAGILLTYGL